MAAAEVTLELLTQTGGVGKTFSRWRDELAASIPAGSWSNHSFFCVFKKFCSMTTSLATIKQEAEVAKIELQVIGNLESMVGICLPQIWGKAEADFSSKLLGNTDVFKNAVRADQEFLPKPGDANVPGNFWTDAQELMEPAHEYEILKRIVPVLKKQDDMARVTNDFLKNQVRAGGSARIH